MIYALATPLVLLLLVVLQVTLLDLVTFGWFEVELSLLVVLYSGFHHRALKGGLLALLLGFFLDCLTSPLFGLYTFMYLLIFFLARLTSVRVYGENPMLIGVFAALCQLLEGLTIVLIYRLLLGADILAAVPRMVVPQAFVAGLLCPLAFALLKQMESLIHAQDQQPARSLRTG